jgi:hypothetical protein
MATSNDRTGIYHTFPNGETREIRVPLLDRAMAEIYREWTPAQRLKAADDQFRFARQLLTASVTGDHPGWSPAQVNEEVVRRILGLPG